MKKKIPVFVCVSKCLEKGLSIYIRLQTMVIWEESKMHSCIL